MEIYNNKKKQKSKIKIKIKKKSNFIFLMLFYNKKIGNFVPIFNGLCLHSLKLSEYPFIINLLIVFISYFNL